MKYYNRSKLFVITMGAGMALAVFALFFTEAFAQESAATSDSGLTKPLLAIAAAIAIAGGLIGNRKCTAGNWCCRYGNNCRET